MKLAIGADHAGYLLKEELKQALETKGHEIVDHGTVSTASCDYPDFARLVALDVSEGRAERGILVCSTGVGMSIAANKVKGVRAALGTSTSEVGLTRSHNDANILTLGARYLELTDAEALVDTFLTTDFEGGRHQRRVEKIAALEEK